MTRTFKLESPPGYGTVVPIDTKVHAGLGLRSEQAYGWCRELNAVYLNAVEFAHASLDYPIAFAREAQHGDYMPVAILSMKSQHNLFVDAEGNWQTQTYVPAYFRRYPFCIAEVPVPGGHAAKQMICVQEDRLVRSERPFFTAQGQPTAAWTPMLQLLEAIEGARLQTRVLMKRLEALDLLTPFDAIAVPRKGAQFRLKGMFRVDEEKLQKLQTKDLRAMLKKGELRAIYAHLISLEHFGRLMDLHQIQDGDSEPHRTTH